MAKPTIVCVPGVWHVPAHFDSMRHELENAGYTVLGVDLPGNSPSLINNRPPTLQSDVAAIRTTLLTALETNNVLLVTHSYSSIPGSAALADLSSTARNASNHKTSVISLVIIAGFLCPPHISMLDIMGGTLAPQFLLSEDNLTTLPFAGPGAIEILYNDLPINEALKAVHKLRPQWYAVQTSPIPDQVAAMKGVPVGYLLCSEDNAVPWESQVSTVRGFQDAGVEVRWTRVSRSGHSPFLRFPVETAGFVRLCAGEEGVRGFEELGVAMQRPKD